MAKSIKQSNLKQAGYSAPKRTVTKTGNALPASPNKRVAAVKRNGTVKGKGGRIGLG